MHTIFGVTHSWKFALGMALLVLWAMPMSAQTNRGNLSGTVLDNTGAVVVGAQVSATNAENGTSYSAVTTGGGGYQIKEMSLGAYTLSVSAPGFKTETATGVVIQIATTSALDFHLTAGAVSQTVTVNADAPTLQTETSDIGTVVTAKQVIDLPLSLGGQKGFRAPEAFVFLTPGTVAYGSGSGNAGPSFFSKTSGGQNFGTEVLLDGASTFRSENGSTFDETAPSTEAISEFRVLTSTLPAEYGRTSGGIESFSTRQGANAFHGTAFEIFRNDALDANDLFNNLRIAQNPTDPATRRNNRRPNDKQNDYGGSFSGPVIFPHIYNGRNKTFFFFSFEAYRLNNGRVNVSTLPTAAERGGDFSALLDTTNIVGTNPCTGLPIFSGQIFDPATTRTVGGVECRTAFAGNQIDPARFSAVAKNVLALIPAPTNNGLADNYLLSTSALNSNTSYSVRIDQNLGTRHKLYFSLSERENTPAVNAQFAGPIDTQNAQDFTTHYFRVGYDFVISPTLLNHLNVGYNRTNSVNFGPGARGNKAFPALLGIGNVAGNTFPNFSFDKNISEFGSSTNNDTIDNGYRLNDSINWQFGKHSLKFGGDFRYQKFFPLALDNQTGSFSFSSNQTSAAQGFSNQTGFGFASFLLGQLDSSGLKSYATQPNWIYSYDALFAQDDYKVSPTLTLNLGFRWDVDIPRREKHGATSNISLTTPNPGAGGHLGALVFAGKGAGRNGNVDERWANTWYKDFSPRVGFAWAPDFYHGRTVFRGGYGIYYAGLEYADFGGGLRDGFTANINHSSPNGFDPAFAIDSGFPPFPAPPFLDPAQDNFTSPFYIAPGDGRPGMIQNWSLQVEQQLATDLILDIGYVGQHSTHLHSAFSSLDNIATANFALGNGLFTQVGKQTAVPLPYTGFPNDQTVAQALKPFPQFFNLNQDCCLENQGQSSFNALELQLQRRFHNGLNLLASYTFSKTLTDADSALPFFATLNTDPGAPQNPENKRGEKSISTQDLPQNFVVSYLYELPFGKNKPFLNHSGTLDRVVGGWQVGGVQRYESGQPYAFGCATGVPGFNGCIRFNTSGQPLYSADYLSGHFDPLTQSVFNPGGFVDPNSDSNRASRGGAFGFGNLPRVTGAIRTHVYKDEDFSLIKRTRITERFDINFKVNFLNAFNRHILNRADSNPFDSPLGSGFPNGGFGRVNTTILRSRQIQPELRIEF